MVDDGRSHKVIASLMAIINSLKQIHHIFIELASAMLSSYTIDTFYDNLINHFTCVSVYQDHPLVDQISFLYEFNFNSFQEFNTSNNIMESAF